MIRLVLAALLFAQPLAAQERVLRFVPTGDLRVLDPVWTSAAITLNHAQMIYDVLHRGEISLVGGGENRRSFLWIGDATDALLAILKNEGGRASREIISSSVGRARIIAKRSPSTRTSGISGRELYSDDITAP